MFLCVGVSIYLCACVGRYGVEVYVGVGDNVCACKCVISESEPAKQVF